MGIPEVTLTIQSVRSNSPDVAGTEFRVRRSPTVLGRALDCEIHLTDPSVSRLHLRFDLEKDRIAITNLSRRSLSILDGRSLEAGQRYESRYRSFPIIVGSVECHLRVSYETDEPTWLKLTGELTTEDFIHSKSTLDIPGLTSPPNDFHLGGRVVNEAPKYDARAGVETTPHRELSTEPFVRVIEGRAAAAVSVQGNWLELPRMTALAFAALARTPGVPVAEETIERASGSESMVTKHVSIIRSAIRELIEHGKLSREEMTRQILSFPGFDARELEALSLEALMRKLILSRRGFGYILHIRADDVEFSESR